MLERGVLTSLVRDKHTEFMFNTAHCVFILQSVFIYVAAQLAGAYLAHVLVRCSTLRKELAEARGAFFLVFTICNVVKSGASDSLAAVSIGSMLMAQVYALGGVSGAHFNPAVTFALYLRGLVDSAKAGPSSPNPAPAPAPAPAPFASCSATCFRS